MDTIEIKFKIRYEDSKGAFEGAELCTNVNSWEDFNTYSYNKVRTLLKDKSVYTINAETFIDPVNLTRKIIYYINRGPSQGEKYIITFNVLSGYFKVVDTWVHIPEVDTSKPIYDDWKSIWKRD